MCVWGMRGGGCKTVLVWEMGNVVQYVHAFTVSKHVCVCLCLCVHVCVCVCDCMCIYMCICVLIHMYVTDSLQNWRRNQVIQIL